MISTPNLPYLVETAAFMSADGDSPVQDPRAVTNSEFLQAIFGADAQRAWVCSMHGGSQGWFGNWAELSNVDSEFFTHGDTYFSVSRLRNDATGRRAEFWSYAPVIVVDDVGEKADMGAVLAGLGAPSYALRTSRNSYQFGYILDAPLHDSVTHGRIMNAISIAFGADPSCSDPVHLFRLPRGFNSKPKRVAENGGRPQRVSLIEWHPERQFAAVDLMLALDELPGCNGGTAWEEAKDGVRRHNGLLRAAAGDLEEARQRYLPRDYIFAAFDMLDGVIGMQGSQGYIEVRCPFSDTHTNDDDRTGWNPALFREGKNGFRCFHSDGGAKSSNEDIEAVLRAELDARDGPGTFQALKRASIAAIFPPLTEDEEIVVAELEAGGLGNISERPCIEVCPGALHLMTDDALRRLHEHGRVYQRGGRAVQVKRVTTKTTLGEQALPRIVSVDQVAMLEELSRAARWRVAHRDRKTGENVLVDCNPPDSVAKVLASKTLEADDHLDALSGVINAPFMRRDGTIAQANGAPRYDDETGLWIDPCDVEFRPVCDDECTRDDALAALDVLQRELLSGYEFDGPVSGTVAVSSLLLPFARPAIPLAPGIAIDAPLKGSGKTKLATLPAILATGEPPALIAPSRDSAEELDKQFNAALLGGASTVVLDNIVGDGWGTNTICSAITAEVFKIRPLATSVARDIPNTAIVIVTGNNLSFPSDTGRRFLVCRINPGVERPENRAFDFDPVARAKQNRAKYVHAALTILRAYILAGRPPQGGRALGSFERFSVLVRDALMWLGLPDIAAATDAALASAGPEQSELADVLSAWQADPILRRGEFTTRQLISAASSGMQEALSCVCKGRLDARSLGNWFSKHKDQPVGGVCLAGRQDRTGVTRWRISGEGAPSTSQAAGETIDRENDQRRSAAWNAFAETPIETGLAS